MLGGGSGDGKKLCYLLRQLENTVPSWQFGTPTFICLIVVDEVGQAGHSKSLVRSLIIFKYFLLLQMIWGQNLWHINDSVARKRPLARSWGHHNHLGNSHLLLRVNYVPDTM